MSTQERLTMLARQAAEHERDSAAFSEVGLNWLSGVSRRQAERTRKQMSTLVSNASAS